MKFLCDVHISFKLVNAIKNLGYNCIHVNDILDKWFSKDIDIATFADENDYILISKDADFRDSFFVNKTPKKLVKINLGNIPNMELIKIISDNILKFEQVSKKHQSFIIELDIDNSKYITF